MHDLDWLIGFHFRSATRREFDWVFDFDEDISLTVACLWRLIEDERICITSNDDGQQFGLPAPVDAEAKVNSRLANTAVENIALSAGVLDLSIQFGTRYSVQVVPDSSGYEAWDLVGRNQRFIATGGGELVIF